MEKIRDYSLNRNEGKFYRKLHDFNILVTKGFRTGKYPVYSLKLVFNELMQECIKTQKQKLLFEEELFSQFSEKDCCEQEFFFD